MAVKPCQLVLIKRYPLDPKLRKDYEDEYCAGFEKNWVHYQSNAVLFNRSDVKRDVLPDLPKMPRHQIVVNGLMVETAFEMVELIEKKHFGWIIKRPYIERKETKYQYLAGVSSMPEIEALRWEHFPTKAAILSTEEKDRYLIVLNQAFTKDKHEAQELFTQ